MEVEEVFVVFALRYLVSNLGNVDSLNYKRTGERKRMKVWKNKGYLVVCLTINGIEKSFFVHRLVAICFIPNPHGYTDVHHINEDPLDNRVENLQWISKAKHILEHSKITEAIVIEIFRLRNVEKWTQQRIADHFGISKMQVSYILRRKHWSTFPIPTEYL
jgi:predicted XRE-type DNA-binding protein